MLLGCFKSHHMNAAFGKKEHYNTQDGDAVSWQQGRVVHLDPAVTHEHHLYMQLMIGMMPILAAVGALLAKVTVTTTTKINKAYTEASQGVQQSLSQIRTVAAYNGEERSLKAYEEALVVPTKINIVQSAFTGAVLGSVNFTMYCTDAAAFFYGAWRVSTGHYTGGQVMQVCRKDDDDDGGDSDLGVWTVHMSQRQLNDGIMRNAQPTLT